MAESYFYCEACGRQHRWAEKFAGKKAACKCGTKVRVPEEAVPDAQRPLLLESVDRAYVYCDQCSRQYKWQVEAAGRTFRCSCGNTLRAPMTKPGTKPAAVDDPTSSDFDLFGDEALDDAVVTAPSKAPPSQPTKPAKPSTPSQAPAAPAAPGSKATSDDSDEIDLLSATEQEAEDIGDRSTLVKEPIRGGPMEDDDSDFDLGGGLGDGLGDEVKDRGIGGGGGGGSADDDSEIDFLSEPEDIPAVIACPGCGKQYMWKQEVAGMSAPCRCGAKVKMPLQKPGTTADESGELEFAPDEKEALMAKTSAKGGFICEECGNMIPPGKEICNKCGYNSDTGEMTK